LRDGHVHTPFCPHGSNDSLEQYVERAIMLGYKEISFTEHAPLPEGFVDPTPYKDSAMRYEQLDSYLEALTDLKARYQHDIVIHIGLEVDFILGFEEKTARLLEDVGPLLDDSILSVHFLPCKGQYVCIDYSPEMFADIVTLFGSIDNVYKAYYDAVLQSIRANLGQYKPKRIGHITLIHKFQKRFPCPVPMTESLLRILDEMKLYNYELDYNGAGVSKPLCLQPYPPKWVIREAMKRNIRIVYGSDAHCANDLHQGTDVMLKEAFFV
jgi:histidinol-phosphatase (PHP family)